jgi:hypothetical protein
MSIRISFQLRLSYYPAIICGFLQSVQANIGIVPYNRENDHFPDPGPTLSHCISGAPGPRLKIHLKLLKTGIKLHYI